MPRCSARCRVLGWVSAAACFGALSTGCASRLPGPEPDQLLPGVELDDALGDFAVTLQMTGAVATYGLRHPPQKELVDAEIDAMTAYVERHGAGDLKLERIGDELGGHEPEDKRERLRLAISAIRLMPYLGLDSGPRELGEVAMNTLAAKLGQDGVLTKDISESSSAIATNLMPDVQDGVGFIGLREVEKDTDQRVLTVLSQWSSGPALRAVVLDLSRCEQADVLGAAALLNVFAPGHHAFDLVFRDAETGRIGARRFRGSAEWGTSAVSRAPLFVVTSSRTASAAEALTAALRLHRGARVIGEMTRGTGRYMHEVRLPWGGRFAFTLADFVSPDGQPLSGRPIIPDVCADGAALTALPERTIDAYRAHCHERDLSKDETMDFVRSMALAEGPGTPGARPLKYGEEQG